MIIPSPAPAPNPNPAPTPVPDPAPTLSLTLPLTLTLAIALTLTLTLTPDPTCDPSSTTMIPGRIRRPNSVTGFVTEQRYRQTNAPKRYKRLIV